VEQQYIPAAAAYSARGSGDATAFLAWRAEIERHWKDVRFGALNVTAHDGELAFEVDVYLGRLDPGSVRVELYAEPQGTSPAFKQEMHGSASPAAQRGLHTFSTRVPAGRPAADFTPRIMPHHPQALPLEICRILWQR
jgi:starch phosphorylase